MDAVQKAFDTVAGANYERQDLSSAITVLDGPPRPITQYAPDVRATGLTHYWDEQNLVKAGNGNATYPQGARPPADALAPVRPSNIVCRTGKTAQVTDDMAAVWTGAGGYRLDEGELERMCQEAIDLQTTLKMEEVLNEIEYMHLLGDATNPQGWSGGQCDGLLKWVVNNGVVSAVGTTTGSPETLVEADVKALAQKIARGFPTAQPDTMLIPYEVKSIVNGFVGGGAGRPIVQIVSGDNGGLMGGNEVAKYNTGISVVDVRVQPYLSPNYNPNLAIGAVILYKRDLVRHASLIKLGAEPLARIDTSISRMITCVFTQEHRLPLHAGVIHYVNTP
jgi:hypothetical protein